MSVHRTVTKAAAIARGARGFQRTSCSHHRCLATMAMSCPAPFVLCADFDETITQRDTIALLFELAANSNVRARVQQQQLVGQYTSELNIFLARSDIGWKGRINSSGFDAAGLRAFLDGYAATDFHSLQRVDQSRALRGIPRVNLVAAADSVQLRDGCGAALALADAVCVISANWSEQFVKAAMLRTTSKSSVAPTPQVIANELEMDDWGVTTGKILVKVQSPADKARQVIKVRAGHTSQELQPIVVYVGDSANDLLAMLEAEVGVWLDANPRSSSSKLLQHLVDRHGIEVQHVTAFNSLADCATASKQSHDVSGRRLLFSARDWSQLATVFGGEK